MSTLAHSKYEELFPDTPVQPLCDFSLDIEGAGGQQLPYSGYVETNIAIPGLLEEISCLMLIVCTRYTICTMRSSHPWYKHFEICDGQT